MPRNMSFSITTRQFRERIKDVTRRMGWENVKVGDVVNGCEKCMGLKPGEKVNKLGQIRVVSTRREPLRRMLDDREYGLAETTREGFPGRDPVEFVAMFCGSHAKCTAESVVTRIEFEYLDSKDQ